MTTTRSSHWTSTLLVCSTFAVMQLVARVCQWQMIPYSIPSVGPGANPGVQAVSPQVTVSHPPGDRMPLLFARPAGYLPNRRASPLFGQYQVILLRDRHIDVNNLSKVVTQRCPSRMWTGDLLIASPTLYPLHHRATLILVLYVYLVV